MLPASIMWGNTFSELAKRTDVSRLEFAMFKIEQNLKDELENNPKVLFMDGLYDPIRKGTFKVHLQVSGDDLYAILVLNDYMSCSFANPRFENERMKNHVDRIMDTIASDLMLFFGNSGEYEGKSLSGNNMVHFRIAEHFGY